MNYSKAAFKSGFVAIIGAPNAGKSTLLNQMLGQKISITSNRPQTTRNRILGIVQRPVCQIILLDTPGIHKAKHMLNIRIVEAALATIADVDLILIVADTAFPNQEAEQILIKSLQNHTKPLMLALNKIDLIKNIDLLGHIEKWSKACNFESIIPISAKNGSQVEDLLAAMEKYLPVGPPLYPKDSLTDLPERFIVAEMIREKVFRLTGQEIPYAVAVTIDSFKENKGGLVSIYASIHVERDSQKGIIIGKKGSKLKQIGEAARKDIERMLGTRVFLKLFVRVQKNWSKDTRALRNFGY